MKVYLTGTLNDVYYHKSTYQGKEYEGYQVELFDPDFTNPANRHMAFKFTLEQAHDLKFDQKDFVERLLHKPVSIECRLRQYEGKTTFVPLSVKMV